MSILQLYQRYHSDEFSVETLSQELCVLTQQRFTSEQCLAAHRAILVGEYPNVVHLIDRLNQRNHNTALLSNTCADHWEILKTYPSVKAIKTHFTSFEMKLSKPSPEIYSAVQSQLGQPSDELLFFDDSQENVDGARKCGWNAEYIDADWITNNISCRWFANYKYYTVCTSLWSLFYHSI